MTIGICVCSTHSRMHRTLLLDATKSLCFWLMVALKNQKNCLRNTILIRRYYICFLILYRF